MSKTRYIKTDFWSDSFIETLSTEEKLLFIYLFSNERVDLCGIYEISMKKISFESGIELKKVESIINKFSEKKKVYYVEGYIYLKNFIKHLSLNPSVTTGIERSRNALPKPILEAIHKLDTGCTQEGTLILIPIPILEPILEPIPSEEILPQNINPLDDEYKKTMEYLKGINIEKIDEIIIPDYAVGNEKEWIKFVLYWSESNGKKIKAQTEKTFDIKRRFFTWTNRSSAGNFTKRSAPSRGVA